MAQPSPTVAVTSFYRFIPLSDQKVSELKRGLEQLALDERLLGLCLLGCEGINATISGAESALGKLKDFLGRELGVTDLIFKDSVAPKAPFHVFRVKIKDEIVTMGKPGLAPSSPRNRHLSPREWREALRDPEVIVLDTRNAYEVAIGKFKNATDFALEEFREFPERLKAAQLKPEQKVLMYCTGGIRCEKAILEMDAQGFTNVHQLDGGILNYLEQFPNEDFEGECFVFDYRVAVDQDLQPTRNYKLCPHCGQPANKPITCVKCGTDSILCSACSGSAALTCSKNCAHHVEIGSGSSKAHQQELTKRHKI